MADSTTLTVHLTAETKVQLARLAGHTKREQSFLGAEAITGYVARELAIVDAIELGRADVRAGRETPHDEVMRRAQAIVEGAEIEP